jgi:PAN domain
LPPLRLPGDSQAATPPKRVAGKCWLKDVAPERIERKQYISGIVRSPATESTMEPEHYREGPHLREFDLAQADPKLCENACVGEARCAGWNYRKPEGRTNGRPHPKLCQRQCMDEARCRAWTYKPPGPSDFLALMSNWEGYRELQQTLRDHPGEEGDLCASSCSGIFIGGVDRIGRVLVHRANSGFGETKYGNDERSFDAFYRYMDPGSQFGQSRWALPGKASGVRRSLAFRATNSIM